MEFLFAGQWWPAAANLAALLVWGGMTHQRLRTLERDVAGLHDLSGRMARVEARLEGLYEQFKELNASLRWMRAPEPAYRARRPAPQRPERDDG